MACMMLYSSFVDIPNEMMQGRDMKTQCAKCGHIYKLSEKCDRCGSTEKLPLGTRYHCNHCAHVVTENLSHYHESLDK